MSDVKIFGNPRSTYVRTVRMACVEKGVPFDLLPIGDDTREALKTPDYRKRHPFGRMPSFEHGDVRLFESSAICRYVDEAFKGPALQPADLAERAHMNQWVSAIKDYLAPSMLRGYVRHYFFPTGADGKPDEAALAGARPLVQEHVDIMERALDGRDTLAGGGVTLADLYLLPILFWVGAMPGGMAFFEGCTNLHRWWNVMESRDSFARTMPPLPDEQNLRAAS